MKYSSK